MSSCVLLFASLSGLPQPASRTDTHLPPHLPFLLPQTCSSVLHPPLHAPIQITADKKAKRSQRAPRPARGGKAPAAPAAAAGGARARYAQGAVPATKNARQAAAAANVQGGAVSQGEAFKIIVSNLPLDVDDAAVKVSLPFLPTRVESAPPPPLANPQFASTNASTFSDLVSQDLFDSTIGRTRECSLTYDRNGKHKGVATVVFHARGDAQKAFKTCALSLPSFLPSLVLADGSRLILRSFSLSDNNRLVDGR